MVVYIHSYYLELENTSFAWIQYLVGGICRVANPLFFLISGFLFYNGVNTVKDCVPKILKRIKTLLIPYVIWNIVFVLWYVLLSILPGISGFVNSNILEHFDGSLWDGFSFLFIEPASFPLWFLRDLICLVLFSPVIYYLLKYTRLGFILFLAIISPWLHCVFTGVHVFFYIGGYIALFHSLEKIDNYLNRSVYFISLLLYCGIIYLHLTQNLDLINYTELILNLGAVVFIWKTYDIIAKCRIALDNKFWNLIAGYTFFIYLFHEPTFNIIKKIPVRLVGSESFILVFFFLINPIILVVGSVLLAKLLKKLIPPIYNVAVGGR